MKIQKEWMILAIVIVLSTFGGVNARYASNAVWSWENNTDTVFEIDQITGDSILQGNLTLTNLKWFNGIIDWSNIRGFTDIYIDAPGDIMTGDLNTSASILSQDAIRVYSGAGYVNITATAGSLSASGDFTGGRFISTVQAGALSFIFGGESGGDTGLGVVDGSPDIVTMEVDGQIIQDWTQAGGTDRSTFYADVIIEKSLDVRGNTEIYSGVGYVNITASTGNINLTGNITTPYSNITAYAFNASDGIMINGDYRTVWPSEDGVGFGSTGAFVNLTGDTMTGDLNNTGTIHAQGGLRIYSGTGYVNISASAGDIEIYDDLTLGDDFFVGGDSLLKGNLQAYSGAGYVNITAATGGISMTGDLNNTGAIRAQEGFRTYSGGNQVNISAGGQILAQKGSASVTILNDGQDYALRTEYGGNVAYLSIGTYSALFEDDVLFEDNVEVHTGDFDVYAGAGYVNITDTTGNIELTGSVIPDNDCGILESTFWAEEGGALEPSSFEWSWGNGADDGTGVLPICDGTVVSMSVFCEACTWTITTIEVTINGTGTDCETDVDTSWGGNSKYGIDTGCTDTFSAGEPLNFYTIDDDAFCVKCVASMNVRYD